MAIKKLPELLAPAGSYPAFTAAIASGADAVYMGGAAFNARIGAVNFSDEELAQAINEAHFLNKKVYITLNTLVSDRELPEALNYVERLLKTGADAFIVQDLGLMSAISQCFPEAVLHASTQCITHSLDGVKMLARQGAVRAVAARELDKDNLSIICRESKIEIEAFVHGALCVCHSGACLFSSLVGGRSGNRGECAQPCRLPYKIKGFDGEYPLSLSDLTLSRHLTELAEMGVASLKIEGRMKSADYVGGVVKLFRELIDMGKDATEKDIESLAKIFSRGGFTDGYYTKNLGKTMFGVRSAEDKEQTRAIKKAEFVLPKAKLDADFSITADKAVLTLKAGSIASSAIGQAPDLAINRPITRESAMEQIGKLGQTVFELDSFTFSSDGNYIMPKSALNDMRRRALDGLITCKQIQRQPLKAVESKKAEQYRRYVVLAPHRFEKSVPNGIDRMYFPLFKTPDFTERVGVALPIVITDSEKRTVTDELKRLSKQGIKYAYCESLGAVSLALSEGFEVLAGIRINAYNSYTLERLGELGISEAMMSPELRDVMRRDLIKPIPAGEVIYGRVPLMTMENCIMNTRDGCRECGDFKKCQKSIRMTDRKGISFPVYPEFFHRCQIYNSVVSYNADRPTRDASFGVIFITDEASAEETVQKIINGEKPKEYTRK